MWAVQYAIKGSLSELVLCGNSTLLHLSAFSQFIFAVCPISVASLHNGLFWGGMVVWTFDFGYGKITLFVTWLFGG